MYPEYCYRFSDKGTDITIMPVTLLYCAYTSGPSRVVDPCGGVVLFFSVKNPALNNFVNLKVPVLILFDKSSAQEKGSVNWILSASPRTHDQLNAKEERTTWKMPQAVTSVTTNGLVRKRLETE